ncbi:MAG: hypothetical protein MJY96_10270 [Bacteroidaceae bacterium]|nr:hypothetical protein [Candidatus Colenecus caballi]MCQ2073490.1 hypothetical protein [Bacteroidaceae bacterium]
MHYCFIINNEAKKSGNAPAILKQIEQISTPFDYEIFKTTAVRTAVSFTVQYCNSHRNDEICMVACGGDGTINEVATGMMRAGAGKNVHLAVLAYGSGNDFIKYYKGKDFRNIEALLAGTAHDIDIMKVNEDNYSINICNFGFDAMVCSRANRLTRKGWKNVYRWGLIHAILFGRFNRIDIWADGEKISKKRMLLCTLGNNDHIGAEYCCSPYANNDDGLIEVGLCKCTTLLRFISVMDNYRKGTHLEHPRKKHLFTYRRAKSVRIHSHKPTEICLDGEMLPGQDFQVDIVPQAVSFIIPA